MNTQILIVGAGLAGSTAARLFAEQGKSVLVVERLRHIGGHCHDYRNDAGITVHTYGPHIFHTKSPVTWDFVNRFTSFQPYQHRVLSYAEGQLYPFPINLDTVNRVFGTSLALEEMEAYLQAEAAKADVPETPQNFRDAVVSQVGERLYDLFFKNYTRKQWEREPEELSADLAKRVPVRFNRDDRYFFDQFQGIPEKGYTGLIDGMLDHPNIKLMINTDYFEVKDEVRTDITVYTGELDRLFDYKYGKLEYRSLDFRFETLDMERFQEAAVVNYPNDYAWTRITEYKHFLREESAKTTISYEFPKMQGEPYYIVPTKDNMEKRDRYLEACAPLIKSGTFYLVGRLAEYAYYNMDQVIDRVISLLSGVDFQLKSV